ncbi:hypothetical protein [Rugamonas sp.]|uniref:hypothetical protein n=1 Tax=Rugamonas sp. TaxID=1926287 RepID=UPI0025CD6B78|nr:hypothetical protein [Rugamonas sp.]
MHLVERRSRPNRAMATIVNAALDILATRGLESAAAFLEDAKVPLPVIARVLSEPERRRAADQH